jgi:hypothetical protein
MSRELREAIRAALHAIEGIDEGERGELRSP